MMIVKENVHIRIESKSEGQQVDLTVDAEMIFRNGAVYYRYDEPSEELPGTTTTVKVRDKEIKVIRHGQIRSEQLFSLDEEHPGFYQISHGSSTQQIRLKTHTKQLNIQLNEGIGTIHWSYVLDVDGTDAGTYELKLEILGGQNE